MSGSGGGGGYEYQARAAAYVAAHILAQKPLDWIEHESPDLPVAVAEETGGAGDDLCITLHDGVQIELQAKHGLQKDKLWEPLIKLGQGLQENPQLYGVLLTDTTASKIIREDLRNDFKRLGQGRTDGLKAITQEARQKFVEANLPESDADFFRRLRIIVLDLDDGLQDGKHAQILLSKVLHDPTQSANVWKILWGEGLKLISNAGCRDSKDWARLLSHQGIQLASNCAKANGVMSPEEKKYLELVSKKFEAWWKPHVFMNEIDESTWFEFGLNTKVPKPTDKNNSSQNNNDSNKEITVPILDALSQLSSERILIVGKPGAGKSTLLKQILLRSSKKALEDSNAPIPVLIELNCYTQQPNILELIGAAIEKHDFLLGISDQEKLIYIKNLIKDKRLLLLVDGVNGLSREARSALKDFCDRDLPIILTTREVDAGNLGIRKKLEIQPLKSEKIKEFFNKNLPNHQGRVKELCDRVSDFGQTPLMVWMLYSIFRQNPQSEIPTTRGEAYRRFTTIYVERGKEDINLGEWKSQLSQLAFEMTRSETPIFESYVHNLLGSTQTLNHLLNNHLLQWDDGIPGSRKVEFCHPSLQEYFAAEYLLTQLPELIKKPSGHSYSALQVNYLNYLKWTESFSLLLGFPEVTDDRATEIVSQALNVDLFLGASFASEVKPETQEKTVELIEKLETIELVKLALLERTQSEKATDCLREALKHTEVNIRQRAAWALKSMPENTAISLIEIALTDLDTKVCENAILALRQFRGSKVNLIFDTVLSEKFSSDTRLQALLGLEDIANEEAVFSLLKATLDSEHDVRTNAIHILKEKLDRSLVTKALINALESQDISIVINSIKMLEKLEDESTIPHLEKMQLSPIEEIGDEATESLFFLKRRLRHVNIIKSHHQPEYARYDVEEKRSQKIREYRAELESEHPIRRGDAIIYLASLIGKDIIPLVLKALDDPDTNVKFSACNILATRLIREFPEELKNLQEAIPKLITILEDKNSPPCGEAISALGQLGDMTACPTLSKLCSEENYYVRGRAIEGLVQLSCSEVLPILIGALKDPNALVRSKAARGLAEIQCEEAIPALIDLLNDPDILVQSSIPEVLGKFQGNSTAKYLPTLFERITTVGELVLYAIRAIQSRCGFYNYEIAQFCPPKPLNQNINTQQGIQNVTNYFSFDQRGANIGVNVANEGSIVNFVQCANQNIDFSEQDLAEAARKIEDLLTQIGQNYPITTETQQQTFIQKFLERIESTPDLIKVCLAGGIEGLKILCPTAGIPIEIARSIYEAIQKRYGQP